MDLRSIQARPVSILVHIFGIASIVLVFVWSIHFRGGLAFNATSNKNLIFNVHPVLMISGFIFLSSEANLVYRNIPGSKSFRKSVHLSIHLVALGLGILGIVAVFKFHNELNFVNLYSLHSWFGLITIILFGLQWLAGFGSFFYPGLASSTKVSLLPWHAFAGLLIYVLAVATAELGILENLTFLQSANLIGRYSSEAILANWLGLILALLGASTVLAFAVPFRTDKYSAA